MNDPNRPENNQGGQGNHSPQQPGDGAPPYQQSIPGEATAGGSLDATQKQNQQPPQDDQGPPQATPPGGEPSSGQNQPASPQQNQAEDATQQQGDTAASANTPSSSGPSSGGSNRGNPGGSGPNRNGPRQQRPRSRAFLWLFILALTGAVGGMGYFGYQEFYLKEFANLRDRVDQLDTETLADELAAKQEELTSDWEQRASEVEEQLNSVEEQTDELSELEAKFTELKESISNLEDLDELTQIQKQLDAGQLDRMEEALAEIDKLEELNGSGERLSKLEERLEQLEAADGTGEVNSDQLSGLNERINKLAETVSAYDSKLTDLESQLNELEQINSQQQETAKQLANLESRLDELAKNSQDTAAAKELTQQLRTDLNEKFDSKIAELTKKFERIETLSPEDEESWIKAEATHLVQIAQQRIRYQKDTQSALAALKSADSLYAQLGGGAVDQREAIRAAIDRLIEYTPPDLNGVRERLVATINSIDSLTLGSKTEPEVGGGVPEMADGTAQDGWQRAVNRLREGLGSLIRVERKDQVQQYIPAEQRFFIRENLRMQLEGAILALNRGDQEMFQDNIERATAWLERYFEGDAEGVSKAQQELQDIAQQSIKLDPPDIQSLLDPVKSF